jgi:hypothetical protein
MSVAISPLIVAQWPRNTRDTVMVRIDHFNGRAVMCR